MEYNDYCLGCGELYHCECVVPEAQQKQEKQLQDRYDFRGGGAKDKAYTPPTLGDLLRMRAEDV